MLKNLLYVIEKDLKMGRRIGVVLLLIMLCSISHAEQKTDDEIVAALAQYDQRVSEYQKKLKRADDSGAFFEVQKTICMRLIDSERMYALVKEQQAYYPYLRKRVKSLQADIQFNQGFYDIYVDKPCEDLVDTRQE